MRRSALLLLLVAAVAPAQQPALPPINPAQARLAQTIGGLDGPGFAVVSLEGAGVLAAACERQSIQYWHKDVMLGIRVAEGTPNVLNGHDGAVTALAAAGPVLVSGGADGKLLVWNVAEAKVQHTLSTGAPVRALALSPDGKTLASAGDDRVVQLWDIGAGKAGTKLQAHTDWLMALAFSADGKTLASGGFDGVVRLWDASGKKLLDISATPPPPPNTPPPPINAVMALAFSPDGKILAIGGTDASIHLVTTADGKIVRTLPGHTSSLRALAFHPSGALLVSGSKDRTVRLWNPANGQALKTLEGHNAWVEGVVFVARGTRLASVGADRTVRLWDLTEPAKP